MFRCCYCCFVSFVDKHWFHYDILYFTNKFNSETNNVVQKLVTEITTCRRLEVN